MNSWYTAVLTCFSYYHLFKKASRTFLLSKSVFALCNRKAILRFISVWCRFQSTPPPSQRSSRTKYTTPFQSPPLCQYFLEDEVCRVSASIMNPHTHTPSPPPAPPHSRTKFTIVTPPLHNRRVATFPEASSEILRFHHWSGNDERLWLRDVKYFIIRKKFAYDDATIRTEHANTWNISVVSQHWRHTHALIHGAFHHGLILDD